MSQTDYWVVIPAAGIGSRMGADIPKQYLTLNGTTVLAQTLSVFLDNPRIKGVVVALAADDDWFDDKLAIDDPRLQRVAGGAERCHSVLNALHDLAARANADDWVLVHDAARPCLRPADLDKLIDALASHPVGGLLGVPAGDTMKRSDSLGEIEATVDRQNLWHAQTPQMFRLQLLTTALASALQRDLLVTDEAQAIELTGLRPKLVEGHADNLKITRPEDLPLAELFLQRQV